MFEGKASWNTVASSGIGAAFAGALSARGANLIPGVHSEGNSCRPPECPLWVESRHSNWQVARSTNAILPGVD